MLRIELCVGGCAVRAGSLLNASPYEQHIGTIIFNSAPIGWWTESNIYFPPVHGGISDSPESGICCCLTGCLSVMGLGGAVGAFAPPAPLSKTPQEGFRELPVCSFHVSLVKRDIQ